MNTTLALLPPSGSIQDNIQDNIQIPPLTFPTATPTPIILKRICGLDFHVPLGSTNTPVPPTAAPTVPAATATPAVTDGALSTTPEAQTSATPTAMVSVSPTPTGTDQKPQNRNMTETFLWIALIVLLLVILRSNWGKITQVFGKK